ncbi:uncharacterized protein [Euphorbia lathyris]|uniref:uncharacterized protein n=1 Tax=Euphorbia lathyris TaxID=212925 RepID=UPI003314331E
MEPKSIEISHDEKNTRVEDTKSYNHIARGVPSSPRDYSRSPRDYSHINIDDRKGDKAVAQIASANEDKSGDVNMEADIATDDVIKAGGFGARDDINSFLPGAIDSTDFEASILDARNYEEPQEDKCRHGLGWRESTDGK